MPYITSHQREKLDPLIEKIADQVVIQAKKIGHEAAFAGLLNYCCTSLALKIIEKQFGQIRYWLIAITVGTFKTIADEFYRRIGIPYENKKIKKEGDLKLYHQFTAQIEKI